MKKLYKTVLELLMALVSALLGLGIMLYVYAFASMVNPDLSPAEQRGLILKNIFFSGSVIPFVFGMVLVGTGLVILGRVISQK